MLAIIRRLCPWFSYEVIKNMIQQIIINVPHNVVRPVRPYTSLYAKREVIWTIKNRVTGQKSWRVFCYIVCEYKFFNDVIANQE